MLQHLLSQLATHHQPRQTPEQWKELAGSLPCHSSPGCRDVPLIAKTDGIGAEDSASPTPTAHSSCRFTTLIARNRGRVSGVSQFL